MRTITHPEVTAIDIKADLPNARDGDGVLGTGK